MGGQNDLVAAVNTVSAHAPSPPLYLKQGGGSGPGEFTLTPPMFQKLWTSLPDSFSGKLCALTVPITAPAQIETLFAAVQILAMASGPLPANSPAPGFKFFFYGAEPDDLLGGEGPVYLVQMVVTVTSGQHSDVAVVIKTTGSAVANLAKLMLYALTPLNPIP